MLPVHPPALELLAYPAGAVAPLGVVPGHHAGIIAVVQGADILQPVRGPLDRLRGGPPALELSLQLPAGEGTAAHYLRRLGFHHRRGGV